MEAVQRDYAPKGVQFFYVYKTLAHPEHDGYVRPVSLAERLMHVAEAKRNLGTRFNWICDGMDNAIKRAFGGRNNSEFVFGADGKLVASRTWSNPDELRADLAALVGEVDPPTRVGDLGPGVGSNRAERPAPRGVVARIEIPGRLQPIRSEPVVETETPARAEGAGPEPFFVKLRAEATLELVRNGSGKLYLGFHPDPLYGVHWNNLVDPIEYSIGSAGGATVTPATGAGPKVDEPADVDPREFLIDIEGWTGDGALELTVRYFGCNDAEGWCRAITQRYLIHREQDRDAGRAMRGGGRERRGSFSAFPGGSGRRPSPERMLARLRESDTDGDGEVSRDEFRGPAAAFDRLDANGDGSVSPAEAEQMMQRFRGRERGDSPVRDGRPRRP